MLLRSLLRIVLDRAYGSEIQGHGCPTIFALARPFLFVLGDAGYRKWGRSKAGSP